MNPTHTPTEPGWFYWASSTTNGKWYCEYINQTPAGKLFVQSTLSDVDTTGGFWGGKVPSPGTTFTLCEIAYYGLGFMRSVYLDKDERIKNLALKDMLTKLTDPQDGIAATTQRNKEKRT